jgi:hypothetical protein
MHIFFCYSESKSNYMHRDNYNSATSTFWSAWSDTQIRDYLIEHGYIRSDAQVERDELEKLANDKYVARSIPSDILFYPSVFRYHDFQARSAPYLAWPDARLRAYLRERGVPEDKVPGARPGLLQEARIRWVQSQSRSEVLWGKLRDIVNGVEEGVEERLGNVWALMRGGPDDEEGMRWGENGSTDGKKQHESGKRAAAREQGGRAYSDAEKRYEQGKEKAYEHGEELYKQAGEKVEAAGEKMKTAGQKAQGEL